MRKGVKERNARGVLTVKVSSELRQACMRALDDLLNQLSQTLSPLGVISIHLENNIMLYDLVPDHLHCGAITVTDRYRAECIDVGECGATYDVMSFRRVIRDSSNSPREGEAKFETEL